MAKQKCQLWRGSLSRPSASTLNARDELKLCVIKDLLDGKTDVEHAAAKLHRSVRQVQRLKARAKKMGLSQLIHASRGRLPTNKISSETWEKVISLVRSKYVGIAFAELREILERNHSIVVGRESLRKQLRAAGVPPKRATRRHRAQDDN